MLNRTTRQALASFIFTARATCYNSPKGTLGAVEMPWLKFVPLSLHGGYMVGGAGSQNTNAVARQSYMAH